MAYPKLRYFNEAHMPQREGFTSDISLNCTNAFQWQQSACPPNVKWSGDTPSFKTESELYAETIPNRKARLLGACRQYQENQASPCIDSNFFSLILSSQTVKQIVPTFTCPKCTAVKTWLDTLWTDYGVRKAAIVAGTAYTNDFSDNGNPPYTWDECVAEQS